MRSASSRIGNTLLTGIAISFMAVGCAHKPAVVTQSACAIAWDWVDNPYVSEYRVTVWPDTQTPNPSKSTHRVPAPNTTVPCKSAGADHDGKWLATVQACTKKNACSEPSKVMAFTIGTP
jgi:hypothetical protein